MKACVLVLFAAALVAEAATVKTVCGSGCDYSTLQAAVDAANSGWTIEVAAGQTFSGQVQLKKKNGTAQYIVIRSSAINALPMGKRVTPSDARNMPRLESDSSVITMEAGASYYRLEGLEIAPASGRFVYSLVTLYPRTATGGIAIHEPSDMAHHIIIDRCYIHGWDGQNGPRQGIYLETGYAEVTNSWVSEIKDQNGDSEAILSVGGSGPFVFRNNHLESASITTLMGGDQPSIAGNRAQNVAILGNHYYRPWKWRVRNVTSAPTGICWYDSNGGEYAHDTAGAKYYRCAGGTWAEISSGDYPTLTYGQKNHFELKKASQVLFDGNLIENAWHPAAGSQRGSAILYNQVDYFPPNWTFDRSALVAWVRVQNNRIKNTTYGVSLSGNGQTYHHRFHDLWFDNNLWEGLAWAPGYGFASTGLIQTGSHNEKTWFTRNTFLDSAPTGNGLVALAEDPHPTREIGWVGNISGYLGQGWYDGAGSQGNLNNAIHAQWELPSRSFSKNIVVDTQGRSAGSNYPGRQLLSGGFATADPPNGLYETYPAVCRSCAVGQEESGPLHWENGGTRDVGFVDYANGNYRLKPESPYKGWAHEGADPGADIDVIEWSTAHASDGGDNPYLDFRVRAVKPSRTSATVRFTAYDANSCELSVSDRPDLASMAFQQVDGGGNRDRVLEITGLSPNTRYFFRVLCNGVYRRNGVFVTAP